MRVMADPTTDPVEQAPAGRRVGFADWPLRTKLLATILPLAVVPLLLLTLLTLTTTSDALTTSARRDAGNRANLPIALTNAPRSGSHPRAGARGR